MHPRAVELPSSTLVSTEALSAIQDDASLPICTACGTQYEVAPEICTICADPRQYVPESGQEWTTLSSLINQGRRNALLPDSQDARVSFILTEPGFAINQTPILIETAGGSYIWDCAALITPSLISHLSSLSCPLKAIAISHPHFFTTSLTWAKALNVPLYLNLKDKEWFCRSTPSSTSPQNLIRWWSNRETIGPGVNLIECGGHFPGSSVLHWDRLEEPAPDKNNLPIKPTPVSGLLLTADTVMVQPTQRGFTFIWSAPNIIPLRPHDVLHIAETLKDLPFDQATSTWPGRFIRADAKRIFNDCVTAHLAAMGWWLDHGQLKAIT